MIRALARPLLVAAVVVSLSAWGRDLPNFHIRGQTNTLPLMAAGSPLLRTSTGAVGTSLQLIMLASLVLAVAAELLERYLFFVSVVPRHMAAPYIASAREAV